MQLKTGSFIDCDFVSLGLLSNGKLLITLTSEGWQARERVEHVRNTRGINAALWMLFDNLDAAGISFTDELSNWGFLYGAPGITDALDMDDNGDVWVPYVWHHDQYAVRDEIEEFYTKGYMVWPIARENNQS